MSKDDDLRFWSKVNTEGDCWLWTAARTARGYGIFTWQGHQTTAHRVAFILNNGPIPHGHEVCHRCDNPQCVRPSHLFSGTHAENMHDMIAKGRQEFFKNRPAGPSHPRYKLSETDVADIRRRLSEGEQGKDIARVYGVSGNLISRIKRRKVRL